METLVARIANLGVLGECATEMQYCDFVQDSFPEQPSDTSVHIIVVLKSEPEVIVQLPAPSK